MCRISFMSVRDLFIAPSKRGAPMAVIDGARRRIFRRKAWRCGFALALALTSPTGGVAMGQSSKNGEVKALQLGLVSEINKPAIEEHFRDFVRYVSRRIAPAAEAGAKVVIAPTPFELTKLLEQRRVDYYMESVYPTYTINYVHGAGRTLLRRWKGGQAEYQSLIFTKRDGGIKQLADLRGKAMIFEDPGSSSGYLMPKLFLSRNGYKLVEKKRLRANAPAADSNSSLTFAASFIEAVRTQKCCGGVTTCYNGLEKKKILIGFWVHRQIPRHLLGAKRLRRSLSPAQ